MRFNKFLHLHQARIKFRLFGTQVANDLTLSTPKQLLSQLNRAEIGYMINTKFQRQGLMQEAITATIDYAFDIMKLHSIKANVNTLNTNSVKILTKNKFKKEAHFRENYFYDGKFLDSIIYCLLQSDLQ